MRQTGRGPFQLEQTEGFLQPGAPVPLWTHFALVLVLRAPPPTEPVPDVCIDLPVGIADRAKTEVVRPPAQDAVELLHHLVQAEVPTPSVRHRADLLTHPHDALLARFAAEQPAAPDRTL